MLAITVMLGICSYYTESRKVRKAPTTVPSVPLLHYAIPRDYHQRYYPIPNPRIVETLLARGESVNSGYGDMTPWQQALAYAHGQQARSDPWPEQLQVLQIITLMLKAGANPLVAVPIVSGLFSTKNYSVEHLLFDIMKKERSRLGCDDGSTEDIVVAEFSKAVKYALKNHSPNLFSSLAQRSSMSSEAVKPSKRSLVRSWIKGFKS
jgi:hypothetical protein